MGQNTGVGSAVIQEQGQVPSTPQGTGGIPSSGQTSSAGVGSTGGWIVWTTVFGDPYHDKEFSGRLWAPEFFREYPLAKGFYDLSKRSGVECKLTLTYYETQTQ